MQGKMLHRAPQAQAPRYSCHCAIESGRQSILTSSVQNPTPAPQYPAVRQQGVKTAIRTATKTTTATDSVSAEISGSAHSAFISEVPAWRWATMLCLGFREIGIFVPMLGHALIFCTARCRRILCQFFCPYSAEAPLGQSYMADPEDLCAVFGVLIGSTSAV